MLLAKLPENLSCRQWFQESVAANSEQAEVKDVDHYQIVSPVEQVEDKEYRREEVHSNPGNITLFRIRFIWIEMFSS